MTIQTAITTSIPVLDDTGLSAPVDLVNPGLTAVLIPNFWTPADISFMVLSNDGTTYIPLYYNASEVIFPIGPQTFRDIDPTIFLGITQLKVRSGSLEAPVTQLQGADVTLIGFFNTTPPTQGLSPNIRRTLYLDFVEQVGEFPAMTINESDVVTFDLSGCLNDGEIILSINSFQLIPVGPLGTTDATPDERVTGAQTITGSMISQRFGNFASEETEITSADGFIEYLVQAAITTTQSNNLVLCGYLSVINVPSVWED